MIEVNLAVALLCILGGGLVVRAYMPHIDWRNPVPADYLAASMGIALLAHLGGAGYRDIYLSFFLGSDVSQGSDTVVNLVITFSEYLALRARLLTIPARDRKGRNFITAAWYPRRVKIALRRRARNG